MYFRKIFTAGLVFTSGALLTSTLQSCGKSEPNNISGPIAVDPRDSNSPPAVEGQKVFRFETFGNEGFWTDAARLPQGIVKAKLTPAQAMKAGLSVNVDALDDATKKAVAAELKKDGLNGPILNSFETTVKLINANAVIGVVAKDTNGDGVIDIAKGDKVGVSCVLCHGITDGSVANLKNGGSIGSEIDGPAAHTIAIGKIFALADNTRAFYPMAQLKGANGKSIGRAPSDEGITKNSSEAEVDAYFSNPKYYPPGTFDDTVDGNGNPMHNTPLFRQDLAAPFGSAGELERLEHFSNTVYTVLLDPTNLLSTGGRAFLNAAAGAAGTKLANDYEYVLADTKVKGYPYTQTVTAGQPGQGENLIGLRVDGNKLLALNAYLVALRSPAGVVKDAAAVERGRVIFRDAKNSCTACHGVNQSEPVPSQIIPMAQIFPGDMPKVLGQRGIGTSVLDTPGNTFDDKMIVINATLRGLERGAAMPLLMDLARKPVFLHDNSVPTLVELFDSKRGAKAPHPFYLTHSHDRWDLAAYLESLDDTGQND